MLGTDRWGRFQKQYFTHKQALRNGAYPLLICLGVFALFIIVFSIALRLTDLGQWIGKKPHLALPIILILVFGFGASFWEASNHFLATIKKQWRNKSKKEPEPLFQDNELCVQVLQKEDKSSLLQLFTTQYDHFLIGRHKDAIPTTKYKMDKLFSNINCGRLLGETITFAVHCDKTLVGLVSVDNSAEDDEEPKFHIGYSISKKYEGRGLMTRSVQAVCDFVMDSTDIEQIWAQCETTNQRSINLLQRIGFQYVETIENGATDGHREFDIHIYLLHCNDND